MLVCSLSFIALFAAQRPSPPPAPPEKPAAPSSAAPAGAPATAPAVSGSAAPATNDVAALAPLDEAAKTIEEGDNTIPLLTRAIALYEGALQHGEGVTPTRRVRALVDMSRALLRLGDLLEKKERRIELYEKGRKVAQQAIALAPRDAEAIFWDTANLASIANTHGVMNSLFAVGDVKAGLGRVLALDPNHGYARQTLAKVFHALPGFVGGSDEKAKELLLEVLRRDPNFTPTWVAMARFAADRGERDEARRWLQKVFHAERSSVPNDYRKFDIPHAKKILAELDAR